MTNALIVDDNPMNLSALEQLLKREGVNVVSIDNPAQIMASLDSMGHVDIVFLDIEFPNYDGIQLVGQIQQDPRLAGVPIVAYSVHISELNEARDAGFHSFIGKPLQVAEFSNQLRRILNGEHVWEVY